MPCIVTREVGNAPEQAQDQGWSQGATLTRSAPREPMIVVMSTTEMPTAEDRRLTRSHDDRIIAGVCGGVARYLDIDPVIPRIGLAVLAVFGGAGLIVYALAWLLIP